MKISISINCLDYKERVAQSGLSNVFARRLSESRIFEASESALSVGEAVGTDVGHQLYPFI